MKERALYILAFKGCLARQFNYRFVTSALTRHMRQCRLDFVVDSPDNVQNEPPKLTPDQLAMAAAKEFEERKRQNRRTTLPDVAKEHGVTQTLMGLASLILRWTPEESQAVLDGSKGLLDLYSVAESRRKANLKPMQKPISMPRVTVVPLSMQGRGYSI